MVDGAFDPLHRGSHRIFSRRPAGSSTCRCSAKSPPIVSQDEASAAAPEDHRAGGGRRHPFISYTHINQFDTETILRELQPKYYVKGRTGTDVSDRPGAHLRRARHQVVYLDTVIDSSSRILKSYTEQQSQR
jgi:hypothetical protein